MPEPRVNNRRVARECALQILYQFDVVGPSPIAPGQVNIPDYWDLVPNANPLIKGYAEWLVDGACRSREAADKDIEKASTNWSVHRMTLVDRNILRLAIFEARDGGVPRSIVINEAVEIAKAFGTEDSGAFVHAVLDHVLRA